MKPSLAFRVVVTVLLVAVVVGFALSIHRQERAENETALCLANCHRADQNRQVKCRSEPAAG
jgi:hypothetical protein